MQDKIDMILNNDRTSKAHIWLVRDEFELLLWTFDIVCKEEEAKRRAKSSRSYGGRKAIIYGSIQQLFFILWYLKTNPKYDIAWVIWWTDKTVISDYIVRYMPILLESLRRLWCVPAQTMEEFKLKYKWRNLDMIRIDWTERRVTRSTKKKIQELYYSGKKNNIQ